MIDITLIGTSALMPLPDRALASVLLKCDGRSILLDCGEGTQSAAKKAGVSLMKTDIIALSHYHGDHIFGLPGLLQTMNVMGRTEPLFLTGPEGLERELTPILSLVGEVGYEIRLFTVGEKPLRLCGLIPGWNPGAYLSVFSTQHRVSSQGYVFSLKRAGKFHPERAKALEIPVSFWSVLQNGGEVSVGGRIVRPSDVLGEERTGLKVAFTGDTRACESIVRAAENADVLISEATFGEDDQWELAEERGHMTFSMAAQLALDAGAKKLVLIHYSPRVVEPEEYLPNARRVFAPTVCGEDGMTLSLCFEDQNT